MPTRYTVIFAPHFVRDLESLPQSVHNKLLGVLPILEKTPSGPHSKIKKLKGVGIGQWRLEIWPYRVRYDIVGNEVHLYRVRHRKDIYRN